MSRPELLRRAWPEAIDNPRTIDTHVLSLRKKIELDPRQPSLIQTVRNVGYRLNMEILSDRVISKVESLQVNSHGQQKMSMRHFSEVGSRNNPR
jgi:two-component system OmpR family response regulator